MLDEQEFHYKLPRTPGGSRPGGHRSRTQGPGLAFATHKRLFDHPDPRRLDLRASLKDIKREWLVRANRQHSSIVVNTIVDVSSSLQFGTERSKLTVVAEFLQLLGFSAFRVGDAVSLSAFDQVFRPDLHMPPRHSRGAGLTMAETILTCSGYPGRPGSVDGLLECASRLSGKRGLVFLVSDFHWPLDSLSVVLEQLVHSMVVPIVVWDQGEVEPPAAGGWLSVNDAETGRRRNLWLRQSVRRRWIEKVEERRGIINAAFGEHDIDPLYIQGQVDTEQLTQYFMDRVA